MNATPHYLLYCETGRQSLPGVWRFVLREAGGENQIEAADAEPDVAGERLQLLTVVRALESLDQPSDVTLVTPDSYVQQGIRFGLPEWRRNGWQWEFFGEMVPVKHSDLWRRVDRAMHYHKVAFCRWRVDGPHASLVPHQSSACDVSGHSGRPTVGNGLREGKKGDCPHLYAAPSGPFRQMGTVPLFSACWQWISAGLHRLRQGGAFSRPRMAAD